LIDRLYDFFDPHPGVGGAIVPLPEKMLLTIQSVSGITATLSDVIGKVKDASKDLLDVLIKTQYLGMGESGIFLKIRDELKHEHMWLLIKYKISEKT
jgi:hypothetical protein